jgi:hypothetical protein
MTTQPERTPGDATQAAPAPGQAGPPTAKPAVLPALLSPVPCPGTPPGTTMPGVLAAGALSQDGRIAQITRLAHAAPGHPDGEADTRPLQPLWKQARRHAQPGLNQQGDPPPSEDAPFPDATSSR